MFTVTCGAGGWNVYPAGAPPIVTVGFKLARDSIAAVLDAAADFVPLDDPETAGVDTVGTDGTFTVGTDELETLGIEIDGFETVGMLGKSGTALYARMMALMPSIAPEIKPLMTLMTPPMMSMTPPAIFPTTCKAPPKTVPMTGAR